MIRLCLQIARLVTKIAYPASYLIVYALDAEIRIRFSVKLSASGVGSAWGWVLSSFLMGWPMPIVDEDLD